VGIVPRSAAANERIRAAQRAAILAAGRTVFARRGLAATMDEVAEAAGISHGLAYRYFAGKAELFRALAEDALTSTAERPGPPELPGTAGERLARVVSALVSNRREHPETFQLLHHVLSDPAAPADLLALAEQRGARFRQALRQLITDGQASGEVAGDDPDQLVTAVTACLDGLGRLALSHPGEATRFPDPAIVLRMLAPQRHAAAGGAAAADGAAGDAPGPGCGR
jgi:AcrR family transcriptional regulator